MDLKITKGAVELLSRNKRLYQRVCTCTLTWYHQSQTQLCGHDYSYLSHDVIDQATYVTILITLEFRRVLIFPNNSIWAYGHAVFNLYHTNTICERLPYTHTNTHTHTHMVFNPHSPPPPFSVILPDFLCLVSSSMPSPLCLKYSTITNI